MIALVSAAPARTSAQGEGPRASGVQSSGSAGRVSRRAMLLLGLAGVLVPGTAASQSQAVQGPLTSPSFTVEEGLPVELPFEIYRGDIRFHAQLNGLAVALLLDDGFMWDELLLWGPAVDSMDLVYTGELPALGRNDSLPPPPPSKIAEGVTLRIPGLEFSRETAVVSPPGSWYEGAFPGSVGQVSGTLLKNFVVGIDFDRMVITLHDPDEFEYDGPGRPIPWEPLGFGPWGVPVSLEFPGGTRREIQVLMDLGYNNQLQIVTGGEHQLPMPQEALVNIVNRGAGMEEFHLARLPTVELGGYKLEDVLVSFLPSDHNTMVFSEVMLGLNLLSRFNVVYDYPRRRMFLEPNGRFDFPFEHNMSGFTARRRKDGRLDVVRVFPDSPAEEGGLVPGDVISHIDERSVAEYSPDDLAALWREEGRAVRVRFIRGSISREISIRLRRLI